MSSHNEQPGISLQCVPPSHLTDHGRKGPEHNGANTRVHWPEPTDGPRLSLLQLMKWSSTKSRGRITPDLDCTLECVDLPRFGTNISALTSSQIGGAVAVADDAPTSFSLKLSPRRICTIGDPITAPGQGPPKQKVNIILNETWVQLTEAYQPGAPTLSSRERRA